MGQKLAGQNFSMQISDVDLAASTKMTSSFTNMEEQLVRYNSDVRMELKNILDYWMNFTTDEENGGFIGKVDHNNRIHKTSPKGSVLNSRILWSFSAAYNVTRDEKYLAYAYKAFDYFKRYFIDEEFGGVYCTVDYTGNPL